MGLFDDMMAGKEIFKSTVKTCKTGYKFIKENGPKAMDLAKKSGESLSNKVEDLKKDERVGDLMNRVDDLLKK